jgi:hypothetical protein
MTLKKSEKKGEVGTTRFRGEKALITFLKRTKEGEYAKIEKSSLSYPRVKEQRE